MKISRNSWHYKYVARNWTNLPRSLCWYFWKIVISMFAMTGGAIVAAGTLIFAVSILIYPIGIWFYWIPGYDVASAVLWLIVGGFVLYGERQWAYETGRLERPKKVYKEPGLISQYLEAKHRKICPILKYE